MKRMLYQGNLLSKTLVIGIITLFIGMSIVSSTEHNVEDSHTNHHPIESIDVSKETLSRGKIAYAYIAYSGSSGHPEGPCFFDLGNPGDLTSLIIENCPDFLCGTWTLDEKMLVCDENGSLWEIDLCYKTASEIGGGGTVFYGLTYNPVNEKLYGSTGDDLYEIDLDTGNPTFIGDFFINTIMIDIACDIDGVCYGWDIVFSGNSKLYTIDLDTGEATAITDLGGCFTCISSGSFDYETNTLYIAGCSDSCGFLIKIDFENGDVLIGNFEGCAYLSSLVIPYSDDFCPPVTTHSLDPPEPDGENGWYVSVVEVTLKATDDLSGVKEIRWIVNDGPEQIFKGSSVLFILHDDGKDIIFKYWAIDNAGNIETKNIFYLNIDKTKPVVSLSYEVIGGNQWQGWDILFTATAIDDISGINRVEFYLNDILRDTVTGPGPIYEWETHYPSNCTHFRVRGLIYNKEITDEYVRFYAILVTISEIYNGTFEVHSACANAYDNAGNWDFDCIAEPCSAVTIDPGIYIFKSLTLPKNYTGYIGRFLIYAKFYTS